MKRSTKISLLLLALWVAGIAFMQGCKEEVIGSDDNPYDDIERPDTSKTPIPIDSLTITYVHQKVLAPKCAVPGCHVGNFEPDFRTPQSSFSSLVYAPVLKNNVQKSFTYRVVPFDPAKSVLYERITNCCFVNNNDRMPQDNIGVPLSEDSIEIIRQWIANGARDMFGNIPQKPDREPVVSLEFAVLDTLNPNFPYTPLPTIYYNLYREDSAIYNPFIIPQDKAYAYFYFKVTDDVTAENQLQVNKLKISNDKDNFSSALEYQASYFLIPANPPVSGYYVKMNMNALPLNQTLYMRYYVNDGTHAQNTEFPYTGILDAYKGYFSFKRK